MSHVHPTSILDGEINLAEDIVIGPHCVLTGPITLGSGSYLLGNVHLHGPLTLGEANTVYPFVTLGFPPQDLKWDPATPGAGLVIGSGNTFREHVTIHRATSAETPTTVGDENYFMANSHAGHDCRVGNGCVFANGTLLAGHVRVDDRVVTGGNVTIHQFCRVGRSTMLSGTCGLSVDLPPFFMLTAGNVAGAVNLIGLRRWGMSAEEIETVKWVYKTLYRRELSPKLALEALRERADLPLVREYIEFIESSRRGICPAKGKPVRGTA